MRRMQQHNPLVDMVQYQLEASMQLADAMFSGTEKIDRVMLDATRQAVDGQFKLARAITDVKDTSKLQELQTTLAHRPEKSIQYQQKILSAFAEMQAEYGKSIQNYIEHISQSSLAHTVKSAQQQIDAGTQQSENAMLNPVSSMWSVWEQAFRDATSLANRNLMAARSSLESAASLASEVVPHVASAEGSEEHEESEKRHGGAHRKK